MSNYKYSINTTQLPEGYKQTEVGVIPEDWEVTVLGKIASFQGGYAFSSRKFCESGRYQIVKMSNVYGGELNLTRSSSFVDEVDENEKAYLLKKDDILISLTGTVGKNDFGYTCRITNQNNLLLNQRVARIIVNSKSVSTLIEMETKLSRFRKQFFDKAKGGTGNQTNVSTSDIANILIPLPPTIEEQRLIAQALSDVDALIAALDKLIAKKRHIKTATMQQLLTGKTRLPGFGEGKGYKKTDIGVIPEDWKILKLIDVINSFQNGYAFSAQGYVSSGVPIITMAQIGLDGTFKFSYECVNFWSASEFNKLQQYYVNKGDVIISMTDVTPEKNLIGRMTIVCYDKIALLNQRVGLLRLDINKVNSVFLTSLSNRTRWREYCRAIASLGVQANIGTKDIKEGKLVLPPIQEQDAIAQVLSDIDTEITALEKRRTKTQAIKQGMMQELLTGRTRLSFDKA